MATIRDVAREAGVSTATVSRVYNGSSLVTESTTQLVMEVAARLDYWPNSAARSLITNRTYTLGVVLPDLFNEFFSEIIRGIDHAARARRYQIILSCFHDDSRELIAMAKSMRGRIDGLIAMAPDAGSAKVIANISRHFPVVLLNPGFQTKDCSAVSIANYDGARALTRHLLECGHQRIAIVKGPARNVDAEERLRGYRDALSDAGVNSDPSMEILGDFRQESGEQICADILRIRPRPDAVFATNDYMAIGLQSALLAHGVRVPEDIAIAGFDDISLAGYVNPSLTTVGIDAYGLGAKAVRRWFSDSGAGGARTQQEILPARLIVRHSCGGSRIDRISEEHQSNEQSGGSS